MITVYETTNRVRRKNKLKTSSPQGKTSSYKTVKPQNSIHRLAELAKRLTPGRLATPDFFQVEAAKIGEVLNLSAGQIKALALLSEWEGQSPVEYCNSTVLGYLQASCDDLATLSRSDDRPQEKEWALKFLPRLKEAAPELCRRAGVASPLAERAE